VKKTALFSVAALAVFVASVSDARASEEYPAAMKAELDLPSTPSCDLCHAEAKMPVGAADQPFAVALVKRGLLGKGDVKSLAPALDKDKGVDSDGDGAEDLDELSWGGNPNVSDAIEGKPTPEITYGCGGGPSSHGTASLGAFAMVAGLAFSKRRRSRANRTKSGARRK
jgi:hypothetical protein